MDRSEQDSFGYLGVVDECKEVYANHDDTHNDLPNEQSDKKADE